MFSSEVEMAKFLGSTDIISDAYRAISTTSCIYQLHSSRSGVQVLAFHCVPDYKFRFHNKEFHLVSSEDHEVLNFITTKASPKFFINKAVVELFEQNFVKLSELRSQLTNSPLVVTGRGVGAYLAILFTLLHQNALDLEESNGSKTAKHPICITFGSPLLGDEHLRNAISERPQWNSCFLNVVVKTDTLASFYSSSTPYKPFGNFLFCTESGGHTAFEEQVPILAVLDAMASSNVGYSQIHDYRNELDSVRKTVMYRGVSEFGENLNSLKSGIFASQFREVGVLDDISNNLIAKMEDKQMKMIKRKKNTYEPTKKLNEMKISLTYLEWYMKTQRSRGGYYDSYKNAETKKEIESQQEVIKHQRILNQYWKNIVEEKDRMPQKEGAKLRKRWLYGGTNFRRIVEPLYIVEHYKNGKKNYMAFRPKHYMLLEKWSEEERKDRKPSEGRKTKAASLNEDSCFCAHVEEALILLRDLKNGGPTSNVTDLERFEVYILNVIKDWSASADVFLSGSSLMKWWKEYYTYKGSSYDSELARYMKNECYKLYQ